MKFLISAFTTMHEKGKQKRFIDGYSFLSAEVFGLTFRNNLHSFDNLLLITFQKIVSFLPFTKIISYFFPKSKPFFINILSHFPLKYSLYIKISIKMHFFFTLFYYSNIKLSNRVRKIHSDKFLYIHKLEIFFCGECAKIRPRKR
jgi:hypothetical protein